MSTHCALRFMLLLATFACCPSLTQSQQDTGASPIIILQKLALLEEELKGATDEDSKIKISRSLLEIGAPLVDGAMTPASAGLVLQALKAGAPLSADQARFPEFWLTRAVAAARADNEKAGQQAVAVLKKLGAADSKNPEVIKAMAVLQIKGWLNSDSDPAAARQTSPFVNSLGMKFVPVPGTKVLFCIHETRNKDYAAYAAENSAADKTWKNVEFHLGRITLTHKDDTNCPVVNVSWEDATAFCKWLSKKEGKTYRLPTDHEWSFAVGIGGKEKATDTPMAKTNKVPGFPWGDDYPPPKNNVGNYGDATATKESNGIFKSGDLASYHDGAAITANVMSYPANKLGIYDLGGNALEWCQDLYDPSTKDDSRVLRGSSWSYFSRSYLASSCRDARPPFDRLGYEGFRCVLEVGSSSP